MEKRDCKRANGECDVDVTSAVDVASAAAATYSLVTILSFFVTSEAMVQSSSWLKMCLSSSSSWMQ